MCALIFFSFETGVNDMSFAPIFFKKKKSGYVSPILKRARACMLLFFLFGNEVDDMSFAINFLEKKLGNVSLEAI